MSTAKGLSPLHSLLLSPEYLDFFGSLLTTAMVNCEKWFHPARPACSQPCYLTGLSGMQWFSKLHGVSPGRSLS